MRVLKSIPAVIHLLHQATPTPTEPNLLVVPLLGTRIYKISHMYRNVLYKFGLIFPSSPILPEIRLRNHN